MKIRPNPAGEDGSLPLVLLVAIIVAGLIVALFIDVSTGTRLSAADRDFNQAVQVADAGLQEAFTVLAELEESERPPIGAFYLGGEQTGSLGSGDYTWTARRSGEHRWQVRSEGAFGERSRILEAVMAPETLFALAAFADEEIELSGGNTADSYNDTTTNGGQGQVGSNGSIVLKGNAEVDWVARYASATYSVSNNVEVYKGVETGDKQVLPDLGSQAYAPGGACAGGPTADDIADVLPLLPATTYCVSAATFPAGESLIKDTAADDAPTKIYIAPSGNLELLGQGNTGCDGASCVNVKENETDPDATKLQIFLAGGGGEVKANNNSRIAAGIYAPLSACSGPNAQGHLFGSIVCRTLDAKGGWSFHFDERFDEVETDSFAIRGFREEALSTTSFGETNAPE